MRRIATTLALLLATTSLAGCAFFGGDGETTTSTTTTTTSTPVTTTAQTTTTTSTPPVTTTPEPGTISETTFALATPGVPTQIETGRTFNFTLFVNGSTSISSDHVGAHFGTTTSTTPSTSVYDNECVHQAGTLPGTFVVACTIKTDGTWYLRGHARITSQNQTFNYWGPEHTVKVRNFTLTATNVPPTAVGNVSFTFRLNVTGNETLTSDHVGAHWSWNATNNPSTTTLPNECVHQSGSVPGVFDVTCRIPAGGLTPTKAYLFGHARFTDGDFQTNYWTPMFELTVSPGL